MYGTDPFGYSSSNPFQDASAYNNQYVTSQTALAQQQAQQAYWQASQQQQSDQMAFQQAQQAFTNAMSLGSAYGYAPGGNWYQTGAGGASIPPAGTPLQSTMNTLGYAGGIPGVTGFNTGQTLTAQQQYAAQAAQAAGITGIYNQPTQSQYSPGTFVQIQADQLPQGQGQQLAFVTPSGQIQRVTGQQAQQMGYTGQAASIPYAQFMALSQAAPQALPQQTLASQQAYASMNAQAQQSALAASQATGMYQAPTQNLGPGYANNGSSFYQQPQSTQQQYLNVYHDANTAMQAWVNDVNTSLPASAAPSAQETMAAQQQYFNQAQQYAQTYGQYYTPSAPGQAAQPGVNAPQAGQTTQSYQQFQQQAAQSYLQLLSQLQGPADYGQYLKVLGSTPQGLQGLVGAAAGNYIPGGGTTGQAPQAQTLQNLVGAATGGGAGGSGTNAATTTPQQQPGTASPGGQNYQDFLATAQGLPPPSQIAPQSFNAMNASQKQMLGSMYGNIGYAPMDINSMYQSSLPKYAAGSAAGSMRLV
jgi:hypothetical protein